ncbi:hypothetical protein [Defluviitalea phaphyphila]|uniref:hypothetical protein n=1 Tax=Defluviitalea phaphyphila TaxID=1473580 RepID=UPI0007309D30|nr:hypothetical protein [Defluviitalea phaphyphila]
MNNKKLKILIGFILVFAGLYSLMYQFIELPIINIENLTMLILSGAFLILYYKKNKIWALIIGIILGFFSIVNLIKVDYLFTVFMPSIIIIAGLILIKIYYSKKNIEYLIFGSILFWFGIFVTLVLNKVIKMNNIPDVFFVSIGMVFITMYVLGRPIIEKWALLLGIVFIILGVILFVGISLDFIFIYLPIIIPIILVLVGIFIILYNSRKEQ